MITFDHPGWLVLLPLALLPLLRGAPDAATPHPWLEVVPRDGLSRWLDALLRALAALSLAAVVVALAGPHRGEAHIDRIGRGAEIAIVLDRSRSMDESFNRRRMAGGYTEAGQEDVTKAAAARRIVSEFVRQREHDAFSVVLFSANPLAVLPFTQNQAVILATIAASGIGKGLGNTDIGRALLAGIANFDGRAYSGSRAILLISDGGAQLDTVMRQRIATLLKREKAGLYWIYLRGANGRPLILDGSASAEEIAALPEQSLHDYFGKLGIPYKVYDAERPEAVQKAIDDVGRIEQHAIHYEELVPREDLVPTATWLAIAAIGLLLASRALVRRWP